MDRDKLMDLIREMQCNTIILKDEIGKQIDELDYIMSACKSLDSQLAMLKNEIEDEDKDETSEKCKLKEGDYLSIPNQQRGDYDLLKIIKLESEYREEFFLLDMESNIFTNESYSSIEDLQASYRGGSDFYYIDNEFKLEVGGRYLLYDPEQGGDYEVKIVYDSDNKVYKVYNSNEDDLFYEDTYFDDIESLGLRLTQDFRLVKKLRFSIFE